MMYLRNTSRAGAVAAILALAASNALAQSDTWDGGGGDDNFGTGNNWVDNTSPSPGATSDLFFAGTTRLTPFNNYGAFDDFRNIIFNSGAGPFIISGNAIDFFGKIENLSTNTQTVSLTSIAMNTSAREFNPLNGNLTINSADIFTNGNQLNVFGNNGFTLTFGPSSIIKHGGAVSINQASNVLYQSAHTYTGDTFINAGTLQIGSGASANSSIIRVGGTSGSAPATLSIVDSDGGTTVSSSMVVRLGSSGTKAVRATNTSGSNTYAGNVFLDADLNTQINAGGTLAFTGSTIDLKNQTITVGGAGTTIDTQGFDNPNGAEAGNLTKNDGGTLIMQGTSTYRGNTTVNGGRLLVNGTHTGGGPYVVNTGGTLGGTGSIPNNVTVQHNGTLASGASIGTLTINGSLTLNPTSNFEVEIDAAAPGFDADLTIVTGGLDVGGGNLQFVFTPGVVASFSPGLTFVIIRKDSAGAASGPFLSVPAQVAGLQYVIDYAYNSGIGTDARGVFGNGNEIAITFTEVPEPSSLALVGLASVLVLRRRARSV